MSDTRGRSRIPGIPRQYGGRFRYNDDRDANQILSADITGGKAREYSPSPCSCR
jgi:hypothetical protein